MRLHGRPGDLQPPVSGLGGFDLRLTAVHVALLPGHQVALFQAFKYAGDRGLAQAARLGDLSDRRLAGVCDFLEYNELRACQAVLLERKP
jgi:hypothetical protein